MNNNIFDDSKLAEQLLQRTTPPVYGQEANKLIKGKNIIVTGAGGSIGSEIVMQLRRIDPNCRIYFVDNDEYALYRLQLKLTAQPLLDSVEYVLANVSDRAKMLRLFKEVKPDIVFHAAAHKHLPLCERCPEAAIRTNVRGSHIIAEMCVKFNAQYLINISTDKAAQPTSVLGMTKRLAEMIVKSYANETTKIASVRFGNVLGSRGSFLETLRHQISSNSPVTITDMNMNRYFMTIPEAAGLVIESATLANGGSTFVLDMGKPIMITDIVERYVNLMKCKYPNIKLTGIRNGEKIQEELYDQSEIIKKTTHDRISSVDVSSDRFSLSEMRNFYRLARSGTSCEKLKTELKRLVLSSQIPLDRHIRAYNYKHKVAIA